MFGRLKFLGYACAIALGLSWGQSADAATASSNCPTQGKGAKSAPTANPAMFKIVNGKSKVYLLGSVHKLPAQAGWCNSAISEALGSAEAFFFEANLSFATVEFHHFLDQKGYLPRGQTLHEKLSPAAQKEYFKLIGQFGIDQNRLDHLQPGVAVLMLQNIYVGVRMELSPGVDSRLVDYAREHGKQIGYLETLRTQFEVLTELGGGAQVKILEKALTSSEKNDARFRTMFAAWNKGDLKTLRKMHDDDAVDDPNQTVLLLDKRNSAWIPRIESMLNNPNTYLVTVGALHLAGTNSVVELLCAKGWNVERVGTSVQTKACGTAQVSLGQ